MLLALDPTRITQVPRSHKVGQEDREFRHDPPQYHQGLVRRSRPSGEEIGSSKWQRMNGTKKGSPTGVDRDVSDAEEGERGANRQGKR